MSRTGRDSHFIVAFSSWNGQLSLKDFKCWFKVRRSRHWVNREHNHRETCDLSNFTFRELIKFNPAQKKRETQKQGASNSLHFNAMLHLLYKWLFTFILSQKWNWLLPKDLSHHLRGSASEDMQPDRQELRETTADVCFWCPIFSCPIKSYFKTGLPAMQTRLTAGPTPAHMKALQVGPEVGRQAWS